MKKCSVGILLVFLQFAFAFTPLKGEKVKYDFDFKKNYQHWVGDFTDYPVGQEAFYELSWGWTNIPQQSAVIEQNKGMFLSGNNHSDDLFMFIKRQIGGLRPNTPYKLTFQVTLFNNVPPGEFGIGGSPGESVYFKVGASKKEPGKVIEGTMYQLNVDKGNQSQSGKNALVVGNLANPLVNPINPQYEPKVFTNEVSLHIETDHKGKLWIFVGTDSGFEGSTLYYIAHISVLATPKCHKS